MNLREEVARRIYAVDWEKDWDNMEGPDTDITQASYLALADFIIDFLVNRMRYYLQHKSNCLGVKAGIHQNPCTCGLDSILRELGKGGRE
jgi:hypothetical protein